MKLVMIATAVAALAVAPQVAFADPPGGHPPGLAKKPHGMPPGQAKKAWGRGERLPTTYYTDRTYYIVEPARYELRPPPPGYRWVLVEDRAYLTQTRTGLIAEVVASLLR
jgi:hypothetical protein